MNLSKIATLFAGWEETLIWSCLQGCMGYAVCDDEENPSAAQIVIADFCFFAGKPSKTLVEGAAAQIMVPQNEEWERLIEQLWGSKAEKRLRYAIKKEPGVFDIDKLTEYAAKPSKEYTLRLFDEQLYNQAINEGWSRDFCSQFADYEDYSKRGLGVAVVYQNELVAGASSYTVYNGGIEIEIHTKAEFRQKGLGAACGARLILECLSRNLYPSWDAYDLRSVALAEKLGYHLDRSYIVYSKL